MWQKYKKATGKSPTPRNWSPDEMKKVGWCLNNNIAISCMPDWKSNQDEWFIDIKINKNIHRDPKTYTNDTVKNKICEYYEYYYDKHRK